MVGFLPERIEDLKTAVSEACVNAMEHGNKNHPDTRVIININYRDHVFTVSVMDQGKGIHKLSKDIEHPDIEKKINRLQAPRGLGIFLIKQLVDQVEFNQMTQDGHMVRMILRLTG
jgi:serine/threonine-protein kinase RsbW